MLAVQVGQCGNQLGEHVLDAAFASCVEGVSTLQPRTHCDVDAAEGIVKARAIREAFFRADRYVRRVWYCC